MEKRYEVWRLLGDKALMCVKCNSVIVGEGALSGIAER
jgi:hypothetical protein